MTQTNPLEAQPLGAFDRAAVHVLTVTARDARSAIRAVHAGLAETAADLNGLTLNGLGQLVETTLKLTHLTCADARAFSDRLASEPGVLSARVEHHLFRL